jgi:F-type H+-transporting ATPase subunit gamma
LYHSIVESLASEYAARMVSMRNANDNAEEVIQELNLTYNKARQASITTELIDIIGGVEALKG